MSDTPEGPGWWKASNDKWYPPEQSPGGPTGPATPPVAPRLDLGEALSYGWRKFTENLGAMIVIVLIFFGVQIAFNVIVQFIRPESFITAFVVTGLVLAIGIFLAFLVEAGIIRAALAVVNGRPPEPSMMFSTQRLAPFAIAAILVSLLSFVGFLFCCIGYVVVRLFLLFYGFFVLDESRNVAPADSLKLSFDLVKNNIGDVLVFAIVIVLINLVTCGLAIGFTNIAVGYAYKKLNGEPVAA